LVASFLGARLARPFFLRAVRGAGRYIKRPAFRNAFMAAAEKAWHP